MKLHNIHVSQPHFVIEIPYFPEYTGCPRRNGQNFGRVFLRLNYTDITQNTYIQSWMVTEILAREKCGLLAGSTYCTCTAGWHVTLISHVLESVTHESTQWVGVVSALSAYREWRCGELYMRMCGFCNVWVCMYGFCNVCVLVICIPALFSYPDWGFSVLFSSVVRQMPGYNTQRRSTARTLPT